MTETISAADAAVNWADFVKPNDLVVWTEGAGEPLALTRGLIRAAAGLGGIRVYTAIYLTDSLDAAMPGAVRIYSYGAYGKLSALYDRGMVEVVPGHYSQVGRYLGPEGPLKADVALVQVTPADAEGRHSLGVAVGHMRMAMEAARCVIAQVNPRLPWTDGAAVVPASAFDHIVEIEQPLLEVPPRAPSAAEREIAARIARLVPDRAVIQLGVGALPDAIAAALADKRDLGVHTGLLTDSFRGLVEAGAITNRYKAIDKGLSVTTSFLGTRQLYDFVDRNPGIVMRETSYTHGAGALLQLEKLHAINSAIEVDLTGQVNAEIAGGRYLGQTGGQVDFQRAAFVSPGGRGIVALASTTPKGNPRIVAKLSGPVTTARSDADTIVTEWGVAELRGRTLSERIAAMIAIAHPDHRDALARAVDKSGMPLDG
jgi:acyl-CoA hydrolase